MALKHDNDDESRQNAMRTLAALVESADEDVEERGLVLLRRIAEMIEHEIRRYTLAFTQCRPDTQSVSVPSTQYNRENALEKTEG